MIQQRILSVYIILRRKLKRLLGEFICSRVDLVVLYQQEHQNGQSQGLECSFRIIRSVFKQKKNFVEKSFKALG
jgi:hypothetical protein